MLRSSGIIIFCLLSFFGRNSFAVAPWNWSPSAPHHDAVVFVQTSQGFGGTGTLICTNKDFTEGIVLTAAHVIGNEKIVSAKWRNVNYTSSGTIIYKNDEEDAALFRVDPPTNAISIPITSNKPPIGARVECIGLGSPMQSLRPYYGNVTKVQPLSTIIDTPVTNGDSGGPIIYNGEIVGVITGGFDVIHRTPDGWQVYSPMIAGIVNNCVSMIPDS